jgi:protein TonB
VNEDRPNRRRKLPGLRLPRRREDRTFGAAVSVLVHLLMILLLATPLLARHEIHEMLQGAGGKGPVGGGGGGHRGTGGQTSVPHEQLRMVSLTPPPKPQAPAIKPPPPAPVLVAEVKKVDLTPEVIRTAVTIPAPSARPLDVAPNVGVGGGSGSDGTNGNGPGRGGGDGSGAGTGRGSGNGPGTGGGIQANYPPSPIEMFLPPYPIPNDVKGFHLIAEFDVDELGRVVSMQFTETRNGGYNKRLAEVFHAFKFRPGTKPDGTPLRMKAQIVVDLY